MTQRAILAAAAVVMFVCALSTTASAAEDDKVGALIAKLRPENSFKVRMQAAILLGRIGGHPGQRSG